MRFPLAREGQNKHILAMSELLHIIREKIAAEGPMSVADYMALALGHPEYGYYQKRDPLGLKGDFITSPEISQIFGEMLGVALADLWQMSPITPGSAVSASLAACRWPRWCSGIHTNAGLPAGLSPSNWHVCIKVRVDRRNAAPSGLRCEHQPDSFSHPLRLVPGPVLLYRCSSVLVSMLTQTFAVAEGPHQVPT